MNDGDESHLEKINQEDYENILMENPELQRNPEYIKTPAQNTRDFIIKDVSPSVEPLSPSPVEEADNTHPEAASPEHEHKYPSFGIKRLAGHPETNQI